MVNLRHLRKYRRSAWRQFYEENAERIFAYVFHLTRGDHSAAEEIHQATWVAAMDAIRKYDHKKGSLEAWLTGIAKNKASTWFRKHNHPTTYLSTDGVADVPAHTGRPDLDSQERIHVVRAAMAEMPSDRREVLESKYLEGLSVKQLSRKMRRSEKSIESLLTRARHELREACHWYFCTDQES
jgi:RNA polymerase sigma-70 factor (ECF subfamily)